MTVFHCTQQLLSSNSLMCDCKVLADQKEKGWSWTLCSILSYTPLQKNVGTHIFQLENLVNH